MNKFYKSILAVALLVMAAGSTNAQTRCTVGDKTHYRSYEVSDNMVVRKINDNQVVATPKVEKNIVKTEGKGTGVLQINAFGDYFEIYIFNENGYANMAFPGWDFCEEVDEGTYYITMQGFCDDGHTGQCIYDVVVSSEIDTTTINVDMADAKNFLYVDGKDENGIGYADLPMDSSTYQVNSFLIVGNNIYSSTFTTFKEIYDPMTNYKFNDLKDYCKLFTNVFFTTEDQKLYVVNYPTIAGMNGDVTLENDPSSFVKHDELFNINNIDGLSYYSYSFSTNVGGAGYQGDVFDPRCIFDQSKPYTVVMNAVDNGEPSSYDKQEVRISPVVFNSYDLNSTAWPPFQDVMTPYYMGLDTDGNFFYEPYGNFYNTGYEVASFPDKFVRTPARQYLDETMSYGSRTPLLYQNSCNVTADNNPFGGGNSIQCPTSYIGENGLQRVGDQWQPIVVTLNGNEIWNDSLFELNQSGLELPEVGVVEMHIENNNIENASVEKINNTTIRFDFGKDDIMPPTFTMLQVLDQNGKENDIITNLDYAEINVAAGDWVIALDPMTWAMSTTYVEGAEVELYYKTADDTNFMPLEFTEVEDMFHINYGKYFNVKFSQLEGVNEKWVSMKLVVTDAAGNSQEQILENLFYVDIAWSIVENEGLTSTVYPNPFTNEIRINAAEAINGSASISVFNILGEQVISKAMNCNETTEFVIDGSGLNAGIYFYSISTENGELKGRIVKE